MKVLVVDDIETNRTLAARILEKRGHVVRTAKNGITAIDELAQEDFDLVLMDVHMPGMSGIEAARIIRQTDSHVRCHGVPILAFSAAGADDGPGGLKECLKAGMNGYLVKPLSLQNFIETIEKYDEQPLMNQSEREAGTNV